MDAKSEIRRKIITRMAGHISASQRAMLEETIVFTLKDFEIKQIRTEIATTDDTNEQILKMFEAVHGQHVSEKTMRFYQYTLRKFIDTVHKNLLTIHSMDIEYFMSTLKQKGNSNATVNNYMRNISALYAWMVKQRMVQFNPCDQIKALKVTEKPIERLMVEEFDQLRNTFFGGDDIEVEINGERYEVNGPELISAVNKCMLNFKGI